MAFASYAQATTDFVTFGLPPAAYVGTSNSVVQAHCDAASGFAQTCILARTTNSVAGPPYPQDLVQNVCDIASYTLLKFIGFNPESPNDQAVKQAWQLARQYFEAIRDNKLTPQWVPVDPSFATSSDSPRNWFYPDNQAATDNGSGSIR